MLSALKKNKAEKRCRECESGGSILLVVEGTEYQNVVYNNYLNCSWIVWKLVISCCLGSKIPITHRVVVGLDGNMRLTLFEVGMCVCVCLYVYLMNLRNCLIMSIRTAISLGFRCVFISYWGNFSRSKVHIWLPLVISRQAQVQAYLSLCTLLEIWGL